VTQASTLTGTKRPLWHSLYAMEEGGSLGARGVLQPITTVGMEPFWEQPFLGLPVSSMVKITPAACEQLY